MKSIFYSVLGYILIFCSVLLLSNTNNSVKAESLICFAESTPTQTQSVNFYGSDNETLLYTAEVPYGSTLNSFKSRNMFYYDKDYSVSKNGIDFSYTKYNQFYITNGNSYAPETGQAEFLTNIDKDIQLTPGDYTFSFYQTGGSFVKNTYASAFIYFTDGSYFSLQFTGNHSRAFTITENVTLWRINFQINPGNDFDNYSFAIQLEVGNTATTWRPYFDSLNEYVNGLYLKSAGVSDLSTPVSWSTSKESNNMFPFNVPIKQDYNLYGYINDGITTEYEGELTSRVSDIGNYALTDIVSLNIDGYYLVRGTLNINSVDDLNKIDLDFEVYNSSFDFNYQYFNAICLNGNSEYFDMNFLICSAGSSLYDIGNGYFKLSGQSVQNQSFNGLVSLEFTNSAIGQQFYVYFSNYAFEIYEDNSSPKWRLIENSLYSLDTNYMFTENLDYLVDMNSNTNFGYSLLTEEEKTPFLNHNSKEYFSYNIFSRQDLYFYPDNTIGNSQLLGYIANSNPGNLTNTFGRLEIRNCDFYCDEINYNYQVQDYYFIVDKPTYRVNNALLFYNFDYYNTLYNVNKVVYELSKNGNYYDIVYNGTLPNYKYMYIDNEEINNTIFDRYIFLHLEFNNNNTINLLQNGQYLPYYVGFDFNFAYYVDPLISDISTFEYDFEKPGYKDTGDIFNINWLAIVYNIVVFIAFYFPLTALIFDALGLNYFLGGLLNVISFVFDNPLGNFLLGCLAFIIFFKLMLWFWPIAWEVTKKSTSYVSSKLVARSKRLGAEADFNYNHKKNIKESLHRNKYMSNFYSNRVDLIQRKHNKKSRK